MERATIFYSDKSRWTDNELMSLPRDGRKYELIEGELLMSPMGATHSLVCLNLATLLIRFAWVVDPKRQTVIIHSLDAVTSLARLSDVLTGGEVLPRFKCRLRDIFKLD